MISNEIISNEEYGMITVGSTLPTFNLQYVSSDVDMESNFPSMTNADLKGKWSVIFSWPLDFTFVCPTEILAFNDLHKDFADANCKLVGMSIDSPFVHKEWLKTLGTIHFPMLSDLTREFSEELGIIDYSLGATYRATFIVDPELKIRSITVNDLSVGRNPQETLRLVQAFQTDKLCGCNWTPGQKTLN